MTPLRGEVWWCESPDVGGRPCIVLTRDSAIPRLRRALVAFATTTVRGLVSEVALHPEVDPVTRPCVLNLDTPRTVPLTWLTQRLGRVSDIRMEEVCEAMAAAIDCR